MAEIEGTVDATVDPDVPRTMGELVFNMVVNIAKQLELTPAYVFDALTLSTAKVVALTAKDQHFDALEVEVCKMLKDHVKKEQLYAAIRESNGVTKN